MACDWRRCDELNVGNDRLKMANICGLPTGMRIELNYQAESLDDAICQANSGLPGQGDAPREIIDQLIARALYGILATTRWRTWCKD
jgi:hypothetical protein